MPNTRQRPATRSKVSGQEGGVGGGGMRCYYLNLIALAKCLRKFVSNLYGPSN